MEMSSLLFAVAGVVLVSVAFGIFYADVAVSNNVGNIPGLEMGIFNKTAQLTIMTDDAHEEVRFLEDIPIIGDLVAMVGNALKAAQILWELPSIFLNMIGSLFKVFGIPAWIKAIFNLFIWVAIIAAVIAIMIRYKA